MLIGTALALAGAGAAWAQAAAPVPSAPGIVTGVLGLAVAAELGQPPSQQLRGGVALRLAQESRDGLVWTRLLASDGRHGWTLSAPGLVLPVTAGGALPDLELSLLPPGDRDFEAGASVAVPDGSTLQLTGASRASRVARQEDLMVPPWLAATLAPWPLVRFGAKQGYVPLQALALRWPPVAAATASAPASMPQPASASVPLSAHAQLAARGLLGLSQAPFLAPVVLGLRASAPRPGSAMLDLSEAAGRRPGQVRAEGHWDGPLAAYCSAAPLSGALTSLLSFGQGKTRAFVLAGNDSRMQSAVAFVAEDAPYIARVEEADLDRDGLPEWLLEVVGIYGDGFYSELWVVDGRSLSAGLRIARLPLSRSGSEGGNARTQDAAWWVDAATRTLRVWHSDARGSRLTTQRYAARTLTAQRNADGAALVELGRFESYEAAGQRALQAQGDAAVVLPLSSDRGLRWSAAVPFASATQARAWKLQRGQSAAAVLVLPLRSRSP